MRFTVPVYQRREGKDLLWTTLCPGVEPLSVAGRSAVKLQRELVSRLVETIPRLDPLHLEALQMRRGLSLERLRLELHLKGSRRRKLAGLFPLVVEPRRVGRERVQRIGYHPRWQEAWFPVRADISLEEQAAALFARCWAELGDEDIRALESTRKDSLRAVAFSAEARSLLDQLPARAAGVFDDLALDKRERRPSGALTVLPRLGTNQTARALEEGLPLGLPRSPYREQLCRLLIGSRRRSTLLVGPRGAGKSTLIHRFIHDLTEADDFAAHRNLELIHEVWSLSGKRLIAGMSHVGDWEQRVMDLLLDAKKRKVLLWIEDLHGFGRLGQHRGSDRSLADVLRGPVARGELVLIAECTAEQLRRLEDDAPSFAALFARVYVAPTSAEETSRMLFASARALELRYPVIFHPYLFRSVLELGASLFLGASFPGKALDLLAELAREAPSGPGPVELSSQDLVRLLSRKTGLPELLLRPEERLVPRELSHEFERRVMGQPAAIEAAVDLILRIRAGLTDPRRPYGVYLFTGPTGTGKTALATALAGYLYGDPARLLRLDMSEFASPDGPSRLIGERWAPEGLLTRHVQDQPFSVVLFDEIEKAHPLVLNLLLQLFDEGRLTDAQGNTADFRHTVLIMTSNLGARGKPAVGIHEHDGQAALLDVARAVRDFFPPELFNRIDRVVPFGPLSREAAVEITDKELSHLFARRGLAERAIFVHAHEAVLERIVQEAFDPALGARPVKRYIEDQIGALFVQQIVAGERGAMHVFRVYEAAGSGPDHFALAADRLVEAEPRAGALALVPLLPLSAQELLQHLAGLHAGLARTQSAGGELAAFIRGAVDDHNLGLHVPGDDLAYNLEVLRARLDEHLERVALLLGAKTKQDPELEELDRFAFDEDRGLRVRRFDRRLQKPRVPSDRKQDLLGLIAEAHFLHRALRVAQDRRQHAVYVEILRVGQARADRRFQQEVDAEASLFEALARAYLAEGAELEDYALRLVGGEVLAGRQDADQIPWHRAPEQLILHLVGPCVLERLRDEDGCHVLESLSYGTELLRVRVWPVVGGDSPRAALLRHHREALAFERAIERGEPPAELDPRALSPAVRRLHVEESEPGSGFLAVEAEDYVLGHTERMRVRALGEVLRHLSLLRMSRVEVRRS